MGEKSFLHQNKQEEKKSSPGQNEYTFAFVHCHPLTQVMMMMISSFLFLFKMWIRVCCFSSLLVSLLVSSLYPPPPLYLKLDGCVFVFCLPDDPDVSGDAVSFCVLETPCIEPKTWIMGVHEVIKVQSKSDRRLETRGRRDSPVSQQDTSHTRSLMLNSDLVHVCIPVVQTRRQQESKCCGRRGER